MKIMEVQSRNVPKYYGGAKLVSGLDLVLSGNILGWTRLGLAKLGPRLVCFFGLASDRPSTVRL